MEAFEFTTAGRVLVGAGRSADLPALMAASGTRALVCTGASPDRHAELLAGLRMPAVVFPVTGEPTVDLVRTAMAAALPVSITLPPPIAATTSAPCSLAAATAALARSTVGSPATGNTTVGRLSPDSRSA